MADRRPGREVRAEPGFVERHLVVERRDDPLDWGRQQAASHVVEVLASSHVVVAQPDGHLVGQRDRVEVASLHEEEEALLREEAAQHHEVEALLREVVEPIREVEASHREVEA